MTTTGTRSATELVNQMFTLAGEYADDANTNLTDFTDTLAAAVYTPPTVSLTWSTPTAPTIRAIPDAPELPTVSIDPNNIITRPTPLSAAAPDISISNFDLGDMDIAIPAPPVMEFSPMPAIPTMRDVGVPEQPVLQMPEVPAYLEIETVPFGGVDLRDDWLNRLDERPTLQLVAPTPYKYIAGEKYASDLLAQLKAAIARRMQGGTGLPAHVEQALWDRARSRETNIAVAKERELQRLSDSLGFPLPTGALVTGLQQVRKEYYDQLSTLSRDIGIKQAELEQENLRQVISEGMQLEGKLIDYSSQMEQLAFEASKTAAQNAVELHNAAVREFEMLLRSYESYAGVYKTIIDGQLAKVEVYKARLQAEETKAGINKAKVEQYKAEVEARMANVEIFRAQVGAAQSLVEVEKTKISAAGEQVRAYVAQINAETSKVEAFKAQVQGETAKAEVYRAKAAALSSRTAAEAEVARVHVSRYQALVQAKSAEWDGYRASLSAEAARIDALARQSSAMLDSYRAEAAAASAEAQAELKHWEASIAQYSAGIQSSLQAARINNDAVLTANNARLDAAKVGAQVYAQLVSSAYSMVSANAGISYNAGLNVGYNYSGETDSSVSAKTGV